MIGPGLYDKECTQARESARAMGAILMIFNGDRGNGFSAQLPAILGSGLPRVLREMADQIERDFTQGPSTKLPK